MTGPSDDDPATLKPVHGEKESWVYLPPANRRSFLSRVSGVCERCGAPAILNVDREGQLVLEGHDCDPGRRARRNQRIQSGLALKKELDAREIEKLLERYGGKVPSRLKHTEEKVWVEPEILSPPKEEIEPPPRPEPKPFSQELLEHRRQRVRDQEKVVADIEAEYGEAQRKGVGPRRLDEIYDRFLHASKKLRHRREKLRKAYAESLLEEPGP